ncbi:MAG: Trk system potassium transporter TrkA [Proteobacteria bacterium]|nr:Trk system potassium transporter TrkA [Pseudomonadota bacterium]MBU1640590.1 Trk system potassium transporter TrkA [Pseudomonadota bacterium]
MRIMIVGAGEVGRHLCEKLSIEGQEVVLVDEDEAKLRRLERDLNILPVHGSGASMRVLEEAGIDRTDLFIAVTDSDEVNLIACILSKQYNVQSRIARVRNDDFYSHSGPGPEEALDIDLLISPDLAMAEEILRLSALSDAFDVAEFADGQVELLGYEVYKGNPTVGKSLQQIQAIQSQNYFVIAAIIRGQHTIIPRGNDVIEAGDKIYLVARKKDIMDVEAVFNFTSHMPKDVFIIGGGIIGYTVAKALEKKKINVRLIEQNPVVCDRLTAQLDNTVVLNFDGLEAHDLLEEGIDQAELVIAVTNSDTTNILSSLLAKHHGAKKCITKITKPDFIPMLGKLGIDVGLSPRLVAADMILRFVRGGGKILSVATLLGADAEVVEILITEDREDVTGIALMSMNFPREAVLGAIVRKRKVIIPSGQTKLKLGDTLVIFFAKNAMAEVEAFFS